MVSPESNTVLLLEQKDTCMNAGGWIESSFYFKSRLISNNLVSSRYPLSFWITNRRKFYC